MSIRASAPATTANLGPGFDCLGAALDLELVVELGGDEPLPKRIQKAIRAGGAPADEYRGTITSSIPVARGLGSSAACVAAGLLIGCELAEAERDRDELLRAGTPIEGHPDNLAPALLGGFTVCLPDGSALRFEPSPLVKPLILVPDTQLKTEQARKVLPDAIPFPHALANLARSAGLVAILSGTVEPTPQRLLECTEDLLHQNARFPLMPATGELIADLRKRGIAAAVSGAGPSVVCLCMEGQEVELPSEGWASMPSAWSSEGARLFDA